MSANGFLRGMQRNKPPNLGTCCVCGDRVGVRNVLTLNGLSPSEGKGWGCVQCGLSPNGAIAVVCDACCSQLEAGVAQLLYICAGYPTDPARLPIDLMTGRHEHDLSRHLDDEGGF